MIFIDLDKYYANLEKEKEVKEHQKMLWTLYESDLGRPDDSERFIPDDCPFPEDFGIDEDDTNIE